MGKYPDESCRNCRWTRWTWSDKIYTPENKKRIVVQQPGTCLADHSTAGRGSAKTPLDARQPYSDCPTWEQMG